MKKKATSDVKLNPQEQESFALGKTNWLLIAASLVCIVIGFLLMTGSASGEQFNPDIFSVRRLHGCQPRKKRSKCEAGASWM